MKLLLDTHIFLWALLSPARLDEETVALLESTETEKYLSTASGAEIVAKYASGDLSLSQPPGAFVMSSMAAAGIRELPVTLRDTFAASELPDIHRDPTDRLLIAQASAHRMYVVTDNPVFADYDVKIIDC